MNVLSLFDGMSCGRIALERAGIPVTNYFASEIDKYAMQVSKANWPDIKHVGCVKKIGAFLFPKIDLLIGGSPCQGFSFAGKQLNFNDERSKLFFEFVRILNEIRQDNPDVKFLLENVAMKQEYQNVISGMLGVKPLKINSSLLSAQSRKRLYWTNIPYLGIPKDKAILLKHILQTDFETDQDNKSLCLSAGYRFNPSIRDYSKSQKQLIRLGNSQPSGKGMNGEIYSVDGKAPTITTNKGEGSKIGIIHGKGPTLRTMQGGNLQPKIHTPTDITNKMIMNVSYRKLTVTECERLQTIPDGYCQRLSATTKQISNTQAYKMLGNGWTVDVIVHLLKPLNPAYDFLF